MPCFTPLTGYRSRSVNASGKRSIVFSPVDGFADLPVTVPCGQCVGCRLERSRQWAVRMVHEAQMHRDNCFITLTYDDAHLPAGGTLVKSDLQKFWKRLRRRIEPLRISFYACGEYGGTLGRPHYHACIFGYDFLDKRFYKSTRQGYKLYNSKLLSELWPLGFAVIGALTFDTAAYCARYVTKKITGDAAKDHYTRIDLGTGEVHNLVPEFACMSLKPAIGLRWFDEYAFELDQNDSVVMNGLEMKGTRFYDKLREGDNPKAYARLSRERKRKALKYADNNTPDRLRVRQEVQVAKLKLRNSEFDN